MCESASNCVYVQISIKYFRTKIVFNKIKLRMRPMVTSGLESSLNGIQGGVEEKAVANWSNRDLL